MSAHEIMREKEKENDGRHAVFLRVIAFLLLLKRRRNVSTRDYARKGEGE